MLFAMLSKTVNILLLARISNAFDPVVDTFNDCFDLGSVIHVPKQICYCGFSITQLGGNSNSVDQNIKLFALQCMLLRRSRRKECDSALNSIRKRSFASITLFH